MELTTADKASVNGDQCVFSTHDGKVVAKTERYNVLAYGRDEVLRAPAVSSSDIADLFQRYEKARDRFLNLEAEHHEVLEGVRQDREQRARLRLGSLRTELMRVHDSDYRPLRDRAVQTVLDMAAVPGGDGTHPSSGSG